MSRLRLTPAARADLDSIWTYSVERWNVAQAEAYVQVLLDAFSQIARNPGLGRSIDDVRAGYLKFPVASHIAYYRAMPEHIEVIRILHKSMDAERQL